MRLKEKACVVTGAGSGIGAETARLFAAEGAFVTVADIDGAAAERVARAIGERAMATTVDVARSDEVEAMLARTLEARGRIDVLVNNAGYGIAGTVVDTREEDWNRLMAVNVNGVYLGCRHVIPIMRRQGGGVIVNTASTVAQIGIPNRAAYVASKGAVAALTRAMALDHVGDGIRVNCVAPGTIWSPYFERMLETSPDAASMKQGLEARQPMNRMGRPEEIARAILYLACDDGSFCTGSTLTADGGWTAG
ncbi:MAG: SDR family oxidoreductase [Geminicoccaceae bacterium]|nr:SDR family oxidoreductase [Geminicoccaceae bacterium]